MGLLDKASAGRKNKESAVEAAVILEDVQKKKF
jgi:hypothetical protein